MAEPNSYEVEIRKAGPDDLVFAADVIAKAFMDNDTSLACMGRDSAYRYRFLREGYWHVLRVVPEPFVAFHGDTLVGVGGAQPPGACRVTLEQKLRSAPFMVRSLKPGVVRKSLKTMKARDEHDLDAPHLHLEPLAVDPAVQKLGVGGRLMEAICGEADRLGLPLFGITEAERNLDYFARFGMLAIEEYEVLGVRHWLILREAQKA